jgi:hypothetical protein
MQDVVSSKAPELMNAETFWVRYAKLGVRRDLVYDGTPYHRIDRDFVPPGLAEVDVTLTLEDGVTKFACVMVAGTVGTQVSSSGDVGLSEDGKDDVVRPVAGWWMFKERKLVKSE